MPKKKVVPVPVLNQTLLDQICSEIKGIDVPPDCQFLQNYFKRKVLDHNTKFEPTEADYAAIKTIFPDIPIDLVNLNSLIDYYIMAYPSYNILRDRYYSSILLKYQNINEVENIVFPAWYKEFYCFLKVKFSTLPEMISAGGKMDGATQTKANKSTDANVTGFCFEIAGPTNIINNLVFMSSKDDVLVKYHPNRQTKALGNPNTLRSLLNYPYVEISFNLNNAGPMLTFSRSCECSYNRFIVGKYNDEQRKAMMTYCTNNSKFKTQPSHVESFELAEAKESTSYTHDFIYEYMKTFIGLIKICTERVPDRVKQEYRAVVDEFLADIKEVNLYNKYVLVTNTKLKYVIGSKHFERSKCVKDKESDINFIEIIRPVIKLYFKDFNPSHALDEDQELYFKQLRIFSQRLSLFEDILLDKQTLSFKCTLCDISFYGSQDILHHFQQEHEPEAGVVCPECKDSLDFAVLSERRWKHTCFE